MGLAQETFIQALRGLIMENMQLVIHEPTLARAILYGIIFTQQLVSVSGHTTLPLFHSFKQSLMLTGTHHMLFQ